MAGDNNSIDELVEVLRIPIEYFECYVDEEHILNYGSAIKNTPFGYGTIDSELYNNNYKLSNFGHMSLGGGKIYENAILAGIKIPRTSRELNTSNPGDFVAKSFSWGYMQKTNGLAFDNAPESEKDFFSVASEKKINEPQFFMELNVICRASETSDEYDRIAVIRYSVNPDNNFIEPEVRLLLEREGNSSIRNIPHILPKNLPNIQGKKLNDGILEMLEYVNKQYETGIIAASKGRT